MARSVDIFGRTVVTLLLATDRRTASAVEAEVDVRDLAGRGVLVIDVNNTGGASPTLDILIESSDTTGSGFTTLVTVPQITADGLVTPLVIDLNESGQFVRVNHTIAGTSKSIPSR